MGPSFTFIASPVKTRKDFFRSVFLNFLNIGLIRTFGEKQIGIGSAIFTLISINGHYCAVSQNLFGFEHNAGVTRVKSHIGVMLGQPEAKLFRNTLLHQKLV